MSNAILSIYKYDVSKIAGYVYSNTELLKEDAEIAVRNYAGNYYNEFDLLGLSEISKNKYMFEVISLSDDLEEEKEQEEIVLKSDKEISDIKISIYDENDGNIRGYAYSNNAIDREETIEKIKQVLNYFGYDIGIVNLISLSDKKYMFDAKTKANEYEDTIKQLVKGR